MIEKRANGTQEFYQQVKAGLSQQRTTHKFEHYKLEDGILKYKNMVYLPNSENINKLFLKEMHDVSYAGHFGYTKTVATTKKNFY